MTKDTKNKSIGWLKGVLSNQSQSDQSSKEELVTTAIFEEQSSNMEEPEQSDIPSNKQLFLKDNQDKVSLDLIVSVENMLSDRQLLLYKNKALEDQLYNANETISRLKHDIAKKEQLLQDKNQEISVLESNLTNKQMSYDQLLEDYKDFQYTSKQEFDKISSQLEKEIIKYNKLNEKSTYTEYQNMLKIKELEEKISHLEVENQKYIEQYQRILGEKNQLIETINDFTERMSFSFSPKKTASTTLSE
ncbi:hypothetical protein TEPIDINF_002340 [Tepidibacillus infernus]|uniref:Uncharacterized protein n=1 Tax=Tepidibacillus decaturensis TaxID=1413211 RepID=A0A135L700_9BACI|nr:hypothetical protein [Tepidibacillus decaturensis]KXG44746.1 hypothetical protein U473_12455 [Tepidibacillus decaturensis]